MPLIQSIISVDSIASLQGSSSRGSTSPGLSPLTPGHKGERKIPFFFFEGVVALSPGVL